MTDFDAEKQADDPSTGSHNRAPLEGFYTHAVILWPMPVRVDDYAPLPRLFVETVRRLMS